MGEGFLDPLAPLCFLACGEDEEGFPVTVHCVVVGDVQGKLLICLPAAAWHRKVAKRTVPRGFLSKVIAAEVAAASVADRAVEIPGQTVRVWLGFCEGEAEQSIQVIDGVPSVSFGSLPTGDLLVPFAEALALLWQHQVAGNVSTPVHTANEGADPQGSVPERLASIERALAALAPAGSMDGSTSAAPKLDTRAKAGPAQPPPRTDGLQPRALQSAAPAVYPGLDQSVVAAALASGVEPHVLGEMSRLVDSRPAAFEGRTQPERCGSAPDSSRRVGRGARSSRSGRCAGGCQHFSAAGSKSRASRGLCAGDGSVPRHFKVWVRQAIRARPSFGRHRRWLSGRIVKLWASERSCEKGSPGLSHLCSPGDQQDDRNTDGRGPQCKHARRWVSGSYFNASVVGAQKPDTGLPEHGPPHVGHCRSFGLLKSLQARTGTSSAEHSPSPSRSVLNRSRQLAAGTRVEPRAGTSDELLQETRQCLGSRGSCIQPPVGSTLGRDSSFKAAGGGRVHGSAAEVVAPHDHHEQGARRDSCRPGRATAQKASTKTAESRCISSGRERRAPGSEAPSLSLPALWNSLPRALCRCSGAFASFLRSAHRLEPNRAPTPFTWPCPLPYPEASDGNKPGLWKKRLVNLTVARLSYEHMGCPSSCPVTVRLGVPLNRKQWQQVKNIEHLVFGSFFPLTFEPQDYGRIGHKVEGQAKTLSALGRAAASVCRGFASGYMPRSVCVASVPSELGPSPVQIVGTLPGKPDIAAMPIVADRVKLPANPAFNASPFMDRTTADFFENPLHHARAPDPHSEQPPFVKILADARQKLLLLQALARSGRLEPLKAVPQERAAWGAGLFAVAKDGARDRLVLDARPANELEDFPGKWVHTLASAACLGCLSLRPDEILIMCGTDLQDCFYQFCVTQERLTRNHLACKLSPREAAFVFDRPEDSFCGFGDVVLCGLSSLAMGDSSACEFAQCSHLGVLSQARVVHPGELLVQASPPPRGLLSVGLVIDDLIVLQRCLATELPLFAARPGSSEASVRLQRALAGYDSARLRYSDKKTFEDKTQASFWGVDCCGVSGLIRANPARYWPLVLITVRVLQLGLATRSLLESLLGSWVSVFMIRRRMLCLVELCFQAVRAGTPQSILRLSPELKAELASFVCLGHLAVVDLRAQPLSTVIASDACSLLRVHG